MRRNAIDAQSTGRKRDGKGVFTNRLGNYLYGFFLRRNFVANIWWSKNNFSDHKSTSASRLTYSLASEFKLDQGINVKTRQTRINYFTDLILVYS